MAVEELVVFLPVGDGEVLCVVGVVGVDDAGVVGVGVRGCETDDVPVVGDAGPDRAPADCAGELEAQPARVMARAPTVRVDMVLRNGDLLDVPLDPAWACQIVMPSRGLAAA